MDRLQQLSTRFPVARALDRLDATKTTTPWPLILFLHASSEISEEQAAIGTLAIDSFLMRRAICRMTTKDYNRLFGNLLGAIKAGDVSRSGDLLVAGLASQTAESRIWPDDSAFISGLMNKNLYNDLVRARLRTLLVGLENHLLTSRAEPTTPYRAASKHLTIEHVMPVKWEENWSLPAGVPGSAIERRNDSIHGLGNLTLATQSLNSTLSNQGWNKKRPTLQTHSLARLTTGSILTTPEGVDNFTQDQWGATWDEERIGIRELALIRYALTAWPRPGQPDADFVDLEEIFQETARASEERTRANNLLHGDLLPLIVRRLLVPGDRLRHQKARSGAEFFATVTDSGGLDTSAGHFRAPSTALSKLVGNSRNGWTDP